VCAAVFYQPEVEEGGRAASGGAQDVAPEPPLATVVGTEFHGLCPFPGGLFRAGFLAFFLSFKFFLGFRRPNLITGLSGCQTPD